MSKRGKLEPDESKGLIKEIKNGTAQMQKRFDTSWQQVVDLVKGVSFLARQVEELEKQIEELEAELKSLKEKGAAKK
jgi:polyhydroxyalkanoate synthesis regulator phasin